MTRWWLFPPRTREIQLDEKWSFVAKKEKHCDPTDPDDRERGDHWDHVAFDAEHRLVLAVVPGERTPPFSGHCIFCLRHERACIVPLQFGRKNERDSFKTR